MGGPVGERQLRDGRARLRSAPPRGRRDVLQERAADPCDRHLREPHRAHPQGELCRVWPHPQAAGAPAERERLVRRLADPPRFRGGGGAKVRDPRRGGAGASPAHPACPALGWTTVEEARRHARGHRPTRPQRRKVPLPGDSGDGDARPGSLGEGARSARGRGDPASRGVVRGEEDSGAQEGGRADRGADLRGAVPRIPGGDRHKGRDGGPGAVDLREPARRRGARRKAWIPRGEAARRAGGGGPKDRR